MIKRLQLTCAFLVVLSYAAVAQTGSIKGKIYDKATKEPLPFASVVAELGGAQKGGAQSDFDGEYTIKPLAAGEYTIKISYVGYNDIVITGVLVSVDKITNQDLALSKKVVETQEVEIIAYKVPLIDKGNTAVQSTVTREEIAAAPTRDVRSVAATTAGVFQRDEGDDVNIRGTRDNATDYYIDGIRVRGSQKLPNSGIEQLTVISGGIPAQYGDNTGGVISITTRGPSQEFNGGIEYSTSELFDQYGYNLVSANLSGPIWRKKTADGSRKSMIGFFISGEFQAEDDPDPSSVGMYKISDDKIDNFHKNPITPYNLSGQNTYLKNAEFFTLDDLEKIKIKENTATRQFRFNGKVDFRLSDLTNLTLGGSYNSEDRNTFNIQRAIYNTSENPNRIDTDYRGFLRITQRIGNAVEGEENKSASVIKNIFFSVQAEYQRNITRIQDEEHKDNLWNYGYIGKFKREATETHTQALLGTGDYVLDGDTIFNATVYSHNVGLTDDFFYTSGGVNTNVEAYNNNAVSYNQTGNQFAAINSITGIGGMRNGDAAPTVFAMWQNYANPTNNYQDSDDDDYRFSVSGSADIKNHEISLGFEYEQLIDRNYQLFPRGLWTFARIHANENLSLLSDEYLVSYANDTLVTDFQNAYTAPEYTGFYENIRKALGKSNTEFVNIDELSPDDLDVNFFSPDQINADGLNGIINGYDYTGKKLSGNPTFYDFFNAKKDGAFTREVGAFKPIYMAGYIQDHFNIENLDFNIGVRIDRFDANQSVLKDPYLLYAARTAGELSIPNKPSNIGDDFVVYVKDLKNPDVNEVIGYRDGDVWYDAQGNTVSNPSDDIFPLSNGVVSPYMVNAEEANDVKTIKKEWDPSGSFEDYEPQISVMPRIAFSFSITDQALFFAHYDVLTQRPPDRLFNNPWDWITLSDGVALTLNNPNLKPERKTEYEIGFRQVVSKSSAISISAFYHELKDQIQIAKLYGAYPFDYTTYMNQDFGNVKGLSLAYDLRRTGNIRLTAKYDLQFADGTGSGDRGSLDLVNTDQPNLKVISPLDFDQRHSLSATMDYRYGTGAEYNGPMLFGKPILQNTGMNLVVKAGSGTPYTKSTSLYPEGDDLGLQNAGQRTVDGNINSSRLPWSYRFDIKIDRDFEVKFGQKGDKKKTAVVNVYFLVQNLFDTRNIIAVYRYTGNATDDGYLGSPEGNDRLTLYPGRESAFVDQYGIRLANPNNYSLPRRARLGVSLNF